MKRKLNKKNIIIISIIILIIVVEIINPIKLYNKHVLKQLNYSNSSIETILKYGKKDEVLNSKNNQVLDKIFSSKDYIDSNFNIYKDLNNSNLTNFVSLTNKLINKGYNTLEINSILKSGNEEDINNFLELDYQEEAKEYLKFDFSKLSKYQEYVDYKIQNNLDYETSVLYVNIGLNKNYYEDANTIKDFSITMLVNKYNGLDKDFIPDNLISIDKEYAIDSKQKGNKEMIENFIKMSDDCKTETGFKIIVRSGYRDYKSQEDTYNLYLKTYGLKYAESYAAHPGFSEHQTGLAVDIKAESSNTFAGTKESKWLLENAYKYGFILRYPDDLTDITGYKYESWHYRYVGLEIAKDIKDKKMTYDEYYIRYLDK